VLSVLFSLVASFSSCVVRARPLWQWRWGFSFTPATPTISRRSLFSSLGLFHANWLRDGALFARGLVSSFLVERVVSPHRTAREMNFRTLLALGSIACQARVVRPKTYSLEQGCALAGSELAPPTERESGQGQWSNPYPPQAFDRNLCRFHHFTNDVADALVDRDRENQAFAAFAQDPKFGRSDLFAVNHQARPDTLHGRFGRSDGRDDVIFLFELVARVHHAIGDIAVVREEEQSFSFPVETADGIDPLLGIDQIHHGPTVAFVFGRGDVAARLVE
jgi:hypothetical protein